MCYTMGETEKSVKPNSPRERRGAGAGTGTHEEVMMWLETYGSRTGRTRIIWHC